MRRQIVVQSNGGKRVEPANLDFLPGEYRHISPRHRAPDKYDEMAKRIANKTTGGQNGKTQVAWKK